MSTLDELWEAVDTAWDAVSTGRAACSAAIDAMREAEARLREAEARLRDADRAADAASEAEQERRAAELGKASDDPDSLDAAWAELQSLREPPEASASEQDALFRYGEALGRGLSDAEAREEGWPSKVSAGLALALAPSEALGVALSVVMADSTMDEAQAKAPSMLAHLRAMGFEVVPVAQAPERVRAAILAAVRAAIDEVELSPHHAIGDPWATGYREGWVAARQAVEHA